VDGLMRYMRELNKLDDAKEELLEGLERMRAGVDGAVDALRVDVERAHRQYEERKKRFFRFTGGAEVPEPREMTATVADPGIRSPCSPPAAASGDIDADDDNGWLDDADDDDGDGRTSFSIFDVACRAGGNEKR